VSPWKVILATMVIFGCGVITGGLLVKTTMLPAATPPIPAQTSTATNNYSTIPLIQLQRIEFLRRMQKQLDLTTNQYDQIAEIMKNSQVRTRQVWEEKIGKQMREEYRRVRDEVFQVLNPEQRQKMNELLRRRPPAGERPQRPPPNSTAPTNGT
jgi:Spy/CpxP family protein refolding chaperone